MFFWISVFVPLKSEEKLRLLLAAISLVGWNCLCCRKTICFVILAKPFVLNRLFFNQLCKWERLHRSSENNQLVIDKSKQGQFSNDNQRNWHLFFVRFSSIICCKRKKQMASASTGFFAQKLFEDTSKIIYSVTDQPNLICIQHKDREEPADTTYNLSTNRRLSFDNSYRTQHILQRNTAIEPSDKVLYRNNVILRNPTICSRSWMLYFRWS